MERCFASLYSDIIAKKLPANANQYKKFSGVIKKTLVDITTEINVFLAKSVYSSVSYVQQQNDYYNYVANQLRIEDCIDSVKQGLVALEDLETMLYEEEKQEKDKRLQRMLAFISIMSFIPVMQDIVELVRSFEFGNVISLTANYIKHLIILVPVLGVVCIIIWNLAFHKKKGE